MKGYMVLNSNITDNAFKYCIHSDQWYPNAGHDNFFFVYWPHQLNNQQILRKDECFET